MAAKLYFSVFYSQLLDLERDIIVSIKELEQCKSSFSDAKIVVLSLRKKIKLNIDYMRKFPESKKILSKLGFSMLLEARLDQARHDLEVCDIRCEYNEVMIDVLINFLNKYALRSLWENMEKCLGGLSEKEIKDCINSSIPKDLITIGVATRKYKVSRSTISRKIKDGKLKSYRENGSTSPHMISESEVAGLWPEKNL